MELCGRVEVPIQPVVGFGSFELSVTYVDIPIQPDKQVVFSFRFVFLPMASQDSLVFYCYINRNMHRLVRFVPKKK